MMNGSDKSDAIDMSTDQAAPRELYAWYVVGVLIMAYIAAFLDRQILSLLVGPIKEDLGITDMQVGLLQGFAFALFYSICILPAGWLVDRFSRRNILAIGLSFWCIMTLLCGLSNSFLELFLARMGVGIGEAVLGPAAYSLISNYFRRERLPLAISVYSIGGSLGAGLAYIFGALAADMAAPAAQLLPFMRGLAPWQAAFVIVASPGAAILLLVLTIKEPRLRRSGTQIEVAPVLPFLRKRRRFFVHYCAGIGLLTTVSYANMAWIPTMFERVHGWSTAETARWLGVMMLTFGTAGILTGGFLAMRLSRRYPDATLRVASAAAWALVPICTAAALAPNPYVSLALYAPFTFISTSFVSLGPTSIQFITPNALRGRVNGLSLMFVTIIGISVGPLFIAFITENLFADEMMINWSLGLGASFLSLCAALLISTGLPYYRWALDAVISSEAGTAGKVS